MKSRFATGIGVPPVHLSAINLDSARHGLLIFSGGSTGPRRIAFRSEADLCTKLNILLQRAVPVAVGGHIAGPADQVGMLIDSGKLNGKYIEISWSSPDHWIVREMINGAVEWESVTRADCFVTTDFDPTAIEDNSLTR